MDQHFEGRRCSNMDKSNADLSKVLLVSGACVATVAAIFIKAFVFWWLFVLAVSAAAYGVISRTRPWLSKTSLQRADRNLVQMQASKPDWLAPKYSTSSLGSMSLALAAIFLYGSQIEPSASRYFLFNALLEATRPVPIRLISALIDTGLIFIGLEFLVAIRQHIDPTGKIG